MSFETKSILITGGTGTFGKKFAELMLAEYHPKKLVVFSRDELKQHEMRLSGLDHPSLRYFIGDVRDTRRLLRAFHGIDIVVHAAALKQVPACEYNPIEAVRTNVDGACNIIDAALDTGVEKVVALSTDKAVNPVNLYGATKMAAEKLFVHANAYSGDGPTRFSCVRYGNVVASRGSVIPTFLEQRKSGKVFVTDRRMTRFWITQEQAVRFVIRCIGEMLGGEVFVPKIPSVDLGTLVASIGPDCVIEEVGIRPGEKLHEVLISEDEARHAVEHDDLYIICPEHKLWEWGDWEKGGKRLPEGFRYTSNHNPHGMPKETLEGLLAGLGIH